MKRQLRKTLSSAVLAPGILLLVSASAFAAPRFPERNPFLPDTLFMQAGQAEKQTDAYTVGATWNWNWNRQSRFGLLTGYTEAAVGRWHTDDAAPGGDRWFTQVGVTPVLRLFPHTASNRWFGEIGIGANYIAPVWRAEGKSFSTEFNFGDHIGFGRIFGERGEGSVALRYQHFSNGGIDEPNPGLNFAQLRCSYQF